MTPKFYSIFSLFQKTISIFNKKCDCKGIDAEITFEHSLKTQVDNDFNAWIAKFTSETFGDQKFGGTIERVSELVGVFIEQIAKQTLEACIANADGENGWFKEKPEIIEDLYKLYDELKTLNSTKTKT